MKVEQVILFLKDQYLHWNETKTDIRHMRITEAVRWKFVGDIWACDKKDLSDRMKKPVLFPIIFVLIRNTHAIKSCLG